MALSFINDTKKENMTPVVLHANGGDYYQIYPTSYVQKNSCQLIGSPSEMGLQQFDNKVRQPISIQMTGIVKYENSKTVFTPLRMLIKEVKLSKMLCEFQTKAGQVKKMVIESIEEVGDPSRYDAMEIRVSLVEYLEHNVNSN